VLLAKHRLVRNAALLLAAGTTVMMLVVNSLAIPSNWFESCQVTGTISPTIQVHDVAVIDVTAPAQWAYQGWTINVRIVVTNLGETTENFTVKLYCDSTLIATQAVLNLAPNATLDSYIVWNTASIPYCHNYTINAIASNVTGETNTANNAFVDGQIYVKIMGDVNGDGRVELMDFYELSNAYGSYPSHPRWNSEADLSQDSLVELMDFFIMSIHYGEYCP
jgi:hypothetical protein